MKSLIIAEKPELAKSIVNAIDGKLNKNDGYFEKGNYVVTWAYGHILRLKAPEEYDEENKKLIQGATKYFVLSGFMIDGNELINIQQKLNQIKIKYNLSIDTEAKWNSSYSALKMTLEEYKNYKIEVCEIIAEYKNSVVGIVMDKEKCYKEKKGIKDHNDLYAYSLNLLMERFCMEITNKHGRNTDVPVILFTDSRKNDNNNKLDKELQIAYRRAKQIGTKYIGFPNFSESIVFVDSKYSSGVQLADFCAGVIFKKFENNNSEFLKILLPAIRTHNEKIDGVGIKRF